MLEAIMAKLGFDNKSNEKKIGEASRVKEAGAALTSKPNNLVRTPKKDTFTSVNSSKYDDKKNK